MRVLQAGENASLAQEAGGELGAEAVADALDRGALGDPALVALGQPDFAHAAFAEAAQQAPGTDRIACAGDRLRGTAELGGRVGAHGLRRRALTQGTVGAGMRAQQHVQPRQQVCDVRVVSQGLELGLP